MTLDVNFITETVLVGMNTTGIVEAWKNLKESLEKERVNVDINGNGRYDLIHIHSYGPYAYLKMKNFRGPKVITSHMLPSEMKMLFKGASIFNSFFEKYMKTFYNSADFMISLACDLASFNFWFLASCAWITILLASSSARLISDKISALVIEFLYDAKITVSF